MPKVKKIRALPPKIKEIDRYPEQARASISELESRFSESSDSKSKEDKKVDFQKENESLIESTDSLIETPTPIVRDIPSSNRVQQAQSTTQNTQQTPLPSQVRQVTSSSADRANADEENKFYATTSLASSKQEIQKNYTQTSAWNQAPDPQFDPNRAQRLRSEQVNNPNSLNLQRQNSRDRETSYSEVKSLSEQEKPKGRRPWEA